jgi:DNA-binding response OmpR family regulator
MTAPKTTVWLVDDDDDDLILLESAFQRVDESVRLETMHDGEELVDRLNNSPERPNFVVLDLNMDRLSGMQALREIRQHFPQRELKIVVLTTSFNPDDRFRSEIMGANEFYVKPSDFKEMVELVRGMLQRWAH